MEECREKNIYADYVTLMKSEGSSWMVGVREKWRGNQLRICPLLIFLVIIRSFPVAS